jgi:hypothetical protein
LGSHKAISLNPVRDFDSHKDRIDSTQHKAKQALTAKSDCPKTVVENPNIELTRLGKRFSKI